MPARLSYAIFCDDVRQEMNGKYIAIGVYGGYMSVPSFPWVGTVSFIIGAKNMAPGSVRMSLEVRSARGAIFGKTAMEVQIPDPPPGIFPVGALPIQVSGPETIELWGAIGDQPLRRVDGMQVLQAGATTQAALPSVPRKAPPPSRIRKLKPQ